MNTSKLISTILSKNYLISPDAIDQINEVENINDFIGNLNNKNNSIIINKEVFENKVTELNDSIQQEINNKEQLQEKKIKNDISVIKVYKEKSKKREVQDFVGYYTSRYNTLKKILLQRQELQNAISINRLQSKNNSEEVTAIGIVSSKTKTKNGNIILELEDTTGKINAIISNNKKEIHVIANDVCLDSVIGIKGSIRNKTIFVNNITIPDIPMNEVNKSDEEVYAVFTSDIHVGLNLFYEEDFLKFIDWLNIDNGNDRHKEIASKVKYLFIVGDLVDGVGIYPDQEKDLVIKDVYEQYERCAFLLNKIRKNINIIICGGNHDALRLSEPQPVLDKEIAKPIWDLPNVTIITNPGMVNLCSNGINKGINVLLYHGYSFQYFADNVESIRLNGGMDRPDLIMKYLLQFRHLAPTHTSTLFVADPNEDALVIDIIPDIFVSGHVHRTIAQNYKNVTIIGSGCWVGKTTFQEKVGINPDPGKVVLVNLKTRDVKILNFREDERNK